MRENSKVGLIGKRISQETKLSLLSSSRFTRNYSRRRGLLSEYTINNARVNSVDRRPMFLFLSLPLSVHCLWNIMQPPAHHGMIDIHPSVAQEHGGAGIYL